MDSLHQRQLRLSLLGQHRLKPRLPDEPALLSPAEEARLLKDERDFVETERALVAPAAAQAPREAGAFVAWFEQLRETGPGQGDALFPWLARDATLAQLRWFLAQEVSGEAGFDDLVALTQVRMPVQPKLELARNYWDEMGRGREVAMHGPLLGLLARTVDAQAVPERTVWEALALSNLMVALALDRRYAFHSVGALGVIELTAPGRVAQVDKGLARLGVAKAARRYFSLHATLDVQHSLSWNREIIGPLIAQDPRNAQALAEGALLRLRAGARCFERYRRELWGAGSQPAEPLQPRPIALQEARPDIGPVAQIGQM